MSSIELTTPEVAAHFEAVGDTWKCKQTGFTIKGAIKTFYQKAGGDGFNGLTLLGLPKSEEIKPGADQPLVIQRYERGVVVYDPAHTFDRPPGVVGDCYLSHIDSLYDAITTLTTEKTDLTAQVAHATSTITTVTSEVAALTAKTTALEAELAAATATGGGGGTPTPGPAKPDPVAAQLKVVATELKSLFAQL